MSRSPLPAEALGPTRVRLLPPGPEITLKPDKVTFGDFPVPALRAEPDPEGPIPIRVDARPLRASRRPDPSTTAPRRRRPPRMPEPVYAALRRMAVDIVCCGFIGIAILTLGYWLARTALH